MMIWKKNMLLKITNKLYTFQLLLINKILKLEMNWLPDNKKNLVLYEIYRVNFKFLNSFDKWRYKTCLFPVLQMKDETMTTSTWYKCLYFHIPISSPFTKSLKNHRTIKHFLHFWKNTQQFTPLLGTFI